MDQRLHSAKRAVDQATRQAYAALISSNETILLDDPAAAAAANTNNDNDNSANDDDNNIENTRAGMDLGLALFGTSQSYKDQLEEEFNNRLKKVEEELIDIQTELNGLNVNEVNGAGTNATAIPARAGDHSDNGNDDDDDDVMMADNDVEALQAHIAFLQQCGRAHKLLENVDTLSLSTNFATASSSSSNSMSTPRNSNGGGEVAFPYSPSSLLSSPTDFGKFTFDSPSSTNNSSKDSPLVQAAQLVQQTEDILDNVMATLKQAAVGGVSGDKENIIVNEQHQQSSQCSSKTHHMHTQMLLELQHQTRRKKMELRHRAMALIEGCVSVQNKEEGGSSSGSASLLVRGSGTSTTNSNDKKSVAFDDAVGASPISASTPTNSAIPTGPLSDAYQVLDYFSNAHLPTFGETLDGAMKSLSNKLFVNVIQPCLSEILNGQNDKEGGGAHHHENDLRYYEFHQESLRSVSGGGDRKYDPVSIKGPAVRLQWNLSQTTLGGGGNNGDANTSCIAIAEDTKEALKASSSSNLSSSSTNSTKFLAALNFLSNLFSFVHEHVLVRRSDLSSMLGVHLFGMYPPLSSTGAMSIASGSAILSSGGTLIGSAAMGISDGSERPLMTFLLDAMQTWCIPSENTPMAWRELCEIEKCLVREVGAFEKKMVEMSLMNGSSEVSSSTLAAARSAASAAAASSSPTGLSVLCSDSPINANATLSNLSTLDTSFPQQSSSGHDESKKPSIISPLSELANSLRQSYSESQRSSILNRGRSILLNTDYHNTVQVGTFVPDPCDDADALRKLDSDPLSAFVFHQCSISLTARKILDLCRETLDGASRSYQTEEDEVDQGGNNNVYLDEHLDSLRPMLYRTSRELLDLFRAIVPTLYANEVGSIPRMAAILHNDCVFFAHESLLLGAEYKLKFRSLNSMSEKANLLGEVCSFVDMVPPFRDMATKSMGAMIELQKGQLYELVTPRLANFQQALASNDSVTEWDDADTALRAALHHLRHLFQAWKQVLSRSVYHMSMGNLVDMVFTLFLDPVFKAEDITEASSRFVHSLLLDMAQGVAEIFLFDDGDESSNNNVVVHNEHKQHFEMAKKYSKVFEKSQAVGHFMVQRLDEIQRGLEEGVFRSVTAKELSHLIAAAFDDGDKRMALINALASK